MLQKSISSIIVTGPLLIFKPHGTPDDAFVLKLKTRQGIVTFIG